MDQKTEKSKELQNEFVRLKAAYKRRVEKKKLQWETELSKAKEEQASTREKQNSFIDRETDDVKQLRVKLAGLQDKHRRLGESHIHGFQISYSRIKNIEHNGIYRPHYWGNE